MWYYFPEIVNLEIWKTLKSSETTLDGLMVWRRGWEDARKVTPQGFLGDPTTASPEWGAKAYEDFKDLASEAIARSSGENIRLWSLSKNHPPSLMDLTGAGKLPYPGIPAKAGVQDGLEKLDLRLHGNDATRSKRVSRNKPSQSPTSRS